jgi:4-diphosphocytidyl-2C-methyl-D-erythritol kinase
MSGSGSSLFTLFDGREEADAAGRLVADRYPVRVEVAEVAPRIDDDLGEG